MPPKKPNFSQKTRFPTFWPNVWELFVSSLAIRWALNRPLLALREACCIETHFLLKKSCLKAYIFLECLKKSKIRKNLPFFTLCNLPKNVVKMLNIWKMDNKNEIYVITSKILKEILLNWNGMREKYWNTFFLKEIKFKDPDFSRMSPQNRKIHQISTFLTLLNFAQKCSQNGKYLENWWKMKFLWFL